MADEMIKMTCSDCIYGNRCRGWLTDDRNEAERCNYFTAVRESDAYRQGYRAGWKDGFDYGITPDDEETEAESEV